MEENLFNENLLKEKGIESGPLENCSSLSYHFKKMDGNNYLYCQIDEERLNSYEIKELLKLNEKKNFLSEADVLVLDYIIHRIVDMQSYYRILNDVDLLFSYLKNSKFNVYYDEILIKFSDKKYKLKLNIDFDENANIIFEINDNGEFIFGLDKVFFLKDSIIFKLSDKIPASFYLELVKGKNLFSIESFFSLKNTYLDLLKENHDLSISYEVENLANLNIEEKIAPLVLEVDKTNHFIIVDLKYKINDETFKVDDYKHAETANWLNKTTLIKIVKKDGKLIKYIGDENLSEDLFEKIFSDTKIRYKQYMKVPFRISIPIFHLNNFVSQVIPKAEKILEIDYKHGHKIKLVDGKVDFDVETVFNHKNNFFEFSVRFKICDEYFDLDFIKEVMLRNKKYVQLKNSTTINIENVRELSKWIEFLKNYSFTKKKDKYVGNIETALELDKFLDDFEHKSVVSNQEYKNLISELKHRKPLEQIDMPKQVESILREYQKEGVYWLYFLKKYGFGGILADEMGLGKTLQALTMLAIERKGPNIVVCPKTLIYNWENEVKKYFPDFRVLVIDGDNEKRKKLIESSSQYDIVITAYSMIQKDYEEYMNLDFEFNYGIFDEAHFVKNIKTLSAKAVRLIKTKNKVLLTGTPLENNLDELYGTFDLIMPGYLGTRADFNKDYGSKIERNNMIALELLQAKIRPFILRRIKKEVLKELPDKQESIVYSEMTNKQVAIYNEILNRVRNEINELVKVQGFEKSRIQILSALLKLRQVCNHPALIDKDFANDNDISGKYDQFLELLMEVTDNGEKVLVFSQFTSMLNIFEKELKNLGINYLRLDGSTKDRQGVVDKFNNDETVKVFLISLKAGGVGLNLTSASTVFLYDPWWNPMVEQQAKDRAHRIGQKKTVNIYKFITKNSIEEKILKLQERKGNLFENLVVEDKGFIKRLEWEDLMELFD